MALNEKKREVDRLMENNSQTVKDILRLLGERGEKRITLMIKEVNDAATNPRRK